jgi:putative ABC transport system permease protein
VVFLITALLFLSTALSVLNIIFMLVAERTVEIGTLMAIGARPQDVKFLFSAEAALIGILGRVAGVLIGNVVVGIMDATGVPFKSPFGAGELVIRPQISFGVSAIVLGIAVGICYLSAIVPARKAALVEPVRAFRGQIT